MTRSEGDPERDAFDDRPSADEMLARIRQEGGYGGRGRLRVYLGMAPGVGKTFRMLEEGHRRRARGTDVVIGFVETHGRPRTVEAIGDLEIVPRLRVEYRNVAVEDLDTDAVIRRQPTVALIDELAHTNVPGAPREKRYEDVERILDAGIHVVTTLNIQHLESLAPAVETITGAPVRERLPDEVLDRRGRGRARRHEPPRAPPADAPRQRLSARADRHRARTVLHRGEPDVAAGARPAGGRATRWRTSSRTSRAGGRATAGRWGAGRRPHRRHAGVGRGPARRGPCIGDAWQVAGARPRPRGISEREHLRVRTIREDTEVAVDLGASVVRVEDADAGAGLVEAARRLRLGAPRAALQPTAGLGARLRGPRSSSARGGSGDRGPHRDATGGKG